MKKQQYKLARETTNWPTACRSSNQAATLFFHVQKRSGFFWKAGLIPANQSFFNALKLALIGWKKTHADKVHMVFICIGSYSGTFMVWTVFPLIRLDENSSQ